RDVLPASEDVPLNAPTKRTLYQVDGMGQLLKTTDPTGNASTSTYDIAGRRLSTTTPDGGRVNFAYDPDGQLVSRTTPNLRAVGRKIAYHYDLHHLTTIDYPGTADDVTYAYGDMGAAQQGGTNLDGTPINAQLPHTWNYTYLADRQYDVFLHRRSDTLGNDDNTVFSYDPDTQWLVGQRTVAPRRPLGGQSTAYQEIQDL